MLTDIAARGLRLLPAETAHRATVRLAALAGPFLSGPRDDDPALNTTVMGFSFPNPVGLAAGFDKDGEIPFAMLKLGFGFVECGTVTPRPQSGNPRPRLFRLQEDRAVINRMGFNNRGMEAMARRFSSRKNRAGIVGINIGANKDSADRIADYANAFEKLAGFAQYVTVNVSSPNTPGLRNLQNPDELRGLIRAVVRKRTEMKVDTRIVLKLAPDLEEPALEEIAGLIADSDVDAIILTNTTIERPPGLKSAFRNEAGGLSGTPLFERSTRVLAFMYRRLEGKIPLIGVGGISSGADAYAKIRAGASLVQLYTALAFEGPGLVARIKTELSCALARDGFRTVSEAVGTARA